MLGNWSIIEYFTPKNILDLVLVYLLIFGTLVWIKNTYVYKLVRGLLIVFLVYFLSAILQLTTLNWLMEKLSTVFILLLIIIFQPELRRFLERLGTGKLFTPLIRQGEGSGVVIIRQLLKAIDHLSKEKIGALIVIESSTNLSEYLESGVPVNGSITSDLLVALFWQNNPTHDGAVIIRENKIAAAGCLLPLTETKISDRRLGTRHRAALGLSEQSDSLILIVSEESGVISIAENGQLTRYITREALETRLFSLYKDRSPMAFKDWFGLNVIKNKEVDKKDAETSS
jgi:diadenylate cyclase